MRQIRSETPVERLARWAAIDNAIGVAAENEQLHAQLAERRVEIDDLRARLAHLTSRVAQVEADNADLRRTVGRPSLVIVARRFAGKVYRRTRSALASRLRR